MSEEKQPLDPKVISDAIRYACDRRIGVIDSGFLCQSLGTLNPKRPYCVPIESSVQEVFDKLQTLKIGCVLVTDPDEKLVGIFSERDAILKIKTNSLEFFQKSVTEVMTANPETGSFQTSIAYALNLMSHGGFRHLPLVDENNVPYGIVSVKDIVDYIVETFTSDLLGFGSELP